MYILKRGLNTYFKEINTKNEVKTTLKALETMLFDDKKTAKQFEKVLKNDYEVKFNIIKL